MLHIGIDVHQKPSVFNVANPAEGDGGTHRSQKIETTTEGFRRVLEPPEVSDWRGLINERRQSVTKRTRAKIQIRSLLRTQALRCPYKGLWTRRGMIRLRDLRVEQTLKARIARLAPPQTKQEPKPAAWRGES